MKTYCENELKGNKCSAFWQSMAKHYPLPFDDRMFATTQSVLSLVRSKGVTFHNSEILDIACGTGIYTLPLAREAAMVTGLDDSEAMIDRMKNVMQAEGIQNVRPVRASWKDVDIAAQGFEKAFDIVWVSMTPAVKTAEDFDLIEKCAVKWCVFIGWGRKRKNILMEEIFHLHDIPYGPPRNVERTYDILMESGRKPSSDYFDTSYIWKGTRSEALENIALRIEMQGGTPRHDLIKKSLDRYDHDGLIYHVTDVEQRVMVWSVKNVKAGVPE